MKKKYEKKSKESVSNFGYILGSVEIAIGISVSGVFFKFSEFKADKLLVYLFGMAVGPFVVLAGLLLILATYSTALDGKEFFQPRKFWQEFTITWYKKNWRINKNFIFSDFSFFIGIFCSVLHIVFTIFL